MAPDPGRFLVTSVVRCAGASDRSGFATLVERSSGRIIRRAPIPESLERERDPNPRGGLRGARGVGVWERRLVIANAERLLLFDDSWRPAGEIDHPLLAGIHEVLADGKGIWATSTAADLLLRFDWSGRLDEAWEWRACQKLVERFGLVGLPRVDRELDFRDPRETTLGRTDTVHLNAVARSGDELLLSFGRILPLASTHAHWRSRLDPRRAWRFLAGPPRHRGAVPSAVEGSASAIIALDADRRARELHRCTGVSVPDHNVAVEDGLLVSNDSNGSRLVARPLEHSAEERAVSIPGEPPFARGLEALGGLRYLVGSQAPAAAYEIDLDREEVIRSYPLGGHQNESVFGIHLVPDSFDQPGDVFLGAPAWREA